MKAKPWPKLVANYRRVLAAYLTHGNEEQLQRGYEFGRKALNRGLGVLDMARLHQEAVSGWDRAHRSQRRGGKDAPRAQRMIDAFLMETLSAFEVAHRGFRVACDRLQGLNQTLEQRNRELAETNRKLGQEVVRRKNAQESLQESELKFRSVIESAQDAILTADGKGRLVAVNRAVESMFGYRRDELVGKSFTCLVPKSLREAALFTLDCLARGGEQRLLKRPIESCGLHRNGREFPLEFTLALWRTRHGMFLTGVVRDIRERKQAEQALRESREHYIRLFKEARAMEENLRQLSNKVLTVQEEERKHISRELHDEIGQALTAVNVSIAMLRSHAEGSEAFLKKVDEAQRLLVQSMEMVHRFARELRPSMLDHLGPVAALRNYVKAFTARTGIKTEFEGAVKLEQLNNQQGTVLYRVAQESLTNVFKHAQATRVKIRLRQLPRAVCMEIIDNGRAFKVPTDGNNGDRQPLGLLGMQERVRLVNGQFAIESVPRRGTTVRVQIPLDGDDASAGVSPVFGELAGDTPALPARPPTIPSASN